MPPTEYAFYVGVDWGSERDQVCVLDAERRVCDERAVEHCGPGLPRWPSGSWRWRPAIRGASPSLSKSPAGQRSSRTGIRLCPAGLAGPSARPPFAVAS